MLKDTLSKALIKIIGATYCTAVKPFSDIFNFFVHNPFYISFDKKA